MNRVLLALWILALAAETEAQSVRPDVAVVVLGEPALQSEVRAAARRAGIDAARIRVLEAPNRQEPAEGTHAALREALGTARAHYVETDFAGCLRALPELDATFSLLAQAETTLVGRLLVWRTACQQASGDGRTAQETAALFATLGLPTPDDVASMSPEVEALLAQRQRESEAAPRTDLQVSSEPRALGVWLDGRASGCVTPCTLSTTPGRHLILVRGEGFIDAQRVLSVEGPVARVQLTADRASEAVAAAQWGLRYRGAADATSAGSLRLLAAALGARHLVVLSAEESERDRIVLRAAYAKTGRVAVRLAAPGLTRAELQDESRLLLRRVLERGETIPRARLVRDPWFWVITGVVAAGAVTATALIMRDPETTTSLRFPAEP